MCRSPRDADYQATDSTGAEFDREGKQMNCPDCKGQDCIHIEIRLTDEMVQFYSCRWCEAKWWENEGGPVALEKVLGYAGRR
jgi:DNA-directed RNA polymerase subunit M/transcription elongation factor TFIIS